MGEVASSELPSPLVQPMNFGGSVTLPGQNWEPSTSPDTRDVMDCLCVQTLLATVRLSFPEMSTVLDTADTSAAAQRSGRL